MSDKYIIPSEKVNAVYTESKPPLYIGNPLIEALPPSESSEDIYDRLKCYPPYSSKQTEFESYVKIAI